MATYTVILDACVLYPAPLRSYLLYLAQTGLYRARWTNQIHDEWIRNVLKNRSDLTVEQLAKVRSAMDRHAPNCIIEGYESIIEGIDLPDLDDRHVVAAAIQGQAEGIITFNLKDFPKKNLENLGLSAIHPDTFLSDMFELDPATALRAAQNQRSAMCNPAMTPDEYLDCLQRQKLPNLVSYLRKYSSIL